MSRNKTLAAFVVALAMFSGFVTANRQVPQTEYTGQQQQHQNQPQTQKKKVYVDYEADYSYTIETDTILRMVGNVGYHHNGVIIQCDSSYRYSDSRMDCFGNVIIQYDSTYIYGDKVVYDGSIDQALVYAPLIKITNGTQTVMYTYNLEFNTKTKVGEYYGGGVITQRDNMMESERGFFYSDINEVKLMDSVSMRNADYKVRTDSLRFNLDTEITTFLTRTYIWDSEKDFLTSESGTYEHKTRTYTFTDNAYIMTPDQESWADSIIYKSLTKEAFMKRNIQILDTAQKTLAFGDWGYYNDSIKKAILAARPSIRSWEVTKDSTGKVKIDTAYIRSDSIYMETFPIGTTKPHKEEDNQKDSNAKNKLAEIMSKMNQAKDSTGIKADSGALRSDSLSFDSSSQSIRTAMQLPDSSQIASGDPLKNDSSQLVNAMTQLPDSSQVTNSKSQKDTTERLIRAFRNVEIYRKDFQGRADSTVMYSVDSTMSMFGSPVLWSDNNQITAEQIDAYTKDEQMDWADFIGNPIVAQRVDDSHYNQAKGKTMQAYFTNNEITKSVMSGNVINYYYQDDDGQIVTFDKIETAELQIYYANREPVQMKWIGSSDWVMYPIEDVPADVSQTIEGFSWITKGRATSSRDICTRDVRQSSRSVFELLEKPSFNIQYQIEKYKEQLLKEAKWSDRNDIPIYTVDYFQTGEHLK